MFMICLRTKFTRLAEVYTC